MGRSLVVLVAAACDRSGQGETTAARADEGPLVLTPHKTDQGLFALRTTNTSRDALILSRGVTIEAVEIFGESYAAHELVDLGIPPSDFFLVSTCDESTRGCLSLEPGETVETVPWTGFFASPQCFRETPSDYAAAVGRYRFVVTACNGGERFVSLPFEQRVAEDQ